MDHRISKDMISSGMIPSGEKKQDDLNKTQYGTVPSPNALSDVYKKMYEHHKKDADGNTIPHEGEEINEVAGLFVQPMKKAVSPKKKTTTSQISTKEEVDKFDVVFNHFISEGYSEKEAYAKMSNLTEEQLDEFLKALAQAGMRGAQSVGRATKGIATAAAQQGQNIGKTQAPKPRVSPGQMSLDLKGAGMQDRTAPKSPSEVVEKDSAFQAKKRMSKAIRVAGTMAERQRQRDNMKEEKIDEALPLIPLLGKVAAIAGKAALGAGKAAAGAGKVAAGAGKVGATASKAAAGAGKVATTGAKVTSTGGKVVQGASKGKNILQRGLSAVKNDPVDSYYKARMIGDMLPKPKGLPGIEKNATGNVSAGSYQAASTDLFDIVKGQLLDEGLSEEEIRDIMLTLTPDEILKEIEESSMSDGSAGGDYQDLGPGGFRSKEQINRMHNDPKGTEKYGKKIMKRVGQAVRDTGTPTVRKVDESKK